MVSFLFELPSDHLVHLFVEWLPMKSFGVLDTAICSELLRQQFLSCVNYFIKPVALAGVSTWFSLKSYENWLLLRNIYVKHLSANGSDKITNMTSVDDDLLLLHQHSARWQAIESLEVEKDQMTHENIQCMFQVSPKLVSLCMNGMTISKAKSFSVLVNNCTRLKRLELPSYVKFNAEHAKLLFEHCIRLEYLDLRRVYNADGGAAAIFDDSIAIHCTNLTHILFRFNSPMSSGFLNTLLSRCKKMTHLSIPECMISLAVVFKTIHTNAPQQLQFLDISAGNGTPIERATVPMNGFVQVLLACVKLSSFDLSNLLGMERVIVNAIVPFYGDRLKQLVLSQPRHVDSFELQDSAVLALSTDCRHLQSVDFSGYSMITDISISELARQCGVNLREISLNRCMQITDRSVIVISANCTDLTKLCVSSCHRLTNCSLSDIVKNCTDLEHLDISFCEHFTDALIKRISIKCSKLTNLAMHGNHKLTHGAIGHLRNGCRALRFLSLDVKSQPLFMTALEELKKERELLLIVEYSCD